MRPKMRFVEVKSQAQSDMQASHRARERLVSERTAGGLSTVKPRLLWSRSPRVLPACQRL